jgi:GTP pyrophosphokinase
MALQVDSKTFIGESQLLFQDILSYEPDADPVLFQKAYQLTVRGHSHVKRDSGEPFFEHPLYVARLLVEKNMDSSTVIAGLLHDLVEDTLTDLSYIKKTFGSHIADLVNGVTKIEASEKKMSEWLQAALPSLQNPQQRIKEEQQFESFRKLLIASLEDPRVLIIKLADRVHNMQTLHGIKKKSRRLRIARETLDIYVPIAMRMGIEDWKNQLARAAFKEIYPKQFLSISQMVGEYTGNDSSLINRIATEIKEDLVSSGAPQNISVVGRLKENFSIWLKCRANNLSDISDISDLMGFRITCDNPNQCYTILGLIHTLYQHKPGSFKDYVSVPKPNGYRSLHSGIFGPLGHLIEVQIRTHSMQEINDFGPAAHWRYKEGKELNPLNHPMQILIDLLNAPASNPAEFFNNTRRAIGNEQLQVFTPKGKLITLQTGATVLDFAFAVHTDLGFKCSGARINGITRALPTTLSHGDVVSIVTSDNIHPSPNWLQFAHTQKALANIRRHLNQRTRENKNILGQELVQEAIRKAGISKKEFQQTLPDVAQKMGLLLDQIYSLVGEQKINPHIVVHHTQVFLNHKYNADAPTKQWEPEASIIPCSSCKPVPGDTIIGLHHPSFGIIAHIEHCHLLSKSHAPVIFKHSWKTQKKISYPVSLSVSIKNTVGVLAACCSVLENLNINIIDISFKNNNEISQDLSFTIQITHRKILDKIIKLIENIDAVYSVNRS